MLKLESTYDCFMGIATKSFRFLDHFIATTPSTENLDYTFFRLEKIRSENLFENIILLFFFSVHAFWFIWFGRYKINIQVPYIYIYMYIASITR